MKSSIYKKLTNVNYTDVSVIDKEELNQSEVKLNEKTNNMTDPQNLFKMGIVIERLYLTFLQIIKSELKNLNIQDINPIQSLILYNLGNHGEFFIKVGELKKFGYYLGANASYNLRQMIKHDYIIHKFFPHDRRVKYLKLLPKGLFLYEQLNLFFNRYSRKCDNQIPQLNYTLSLFETLLLSSPEDFKEFEKNEKLKK